MISHVTIQFSEWRKTKWNEIDVELLMDLSKGLAKEIKTVRASVRCCVQFVFSFCRHPEFEQFSVN